ncbi:MAG: hypothetical protein D4R84_15500 [Rhodocyclaceae bacterium]|nr:MAG: hypothetical protein D4R84_15500 [Rhodocyclaceae bacterium]
MLQTVEPVSECIFPATQLAAIESSERYGLWCATSTIVKWRFTEFSVILVVGFAALSDKDLQSQCNKIAIRP